MNENKLNIKEYLAQNGSIAYTNVGTSMMPLICEGKDILIIKKAIPPYKKYDVVLYIRDNGEYVLHRVIKVQKNGTYTLSGDHTTYKEIVRENQIIGILSELKKSNKKTIKTTDFSYKLRSHLWVDFYPIKCFIIKSKYRFNALKNKIKNKIKKSS